ncbi:MAG TPA: argininosuccinate lyase [Pyrinomonadaceae bacterium]|jgi:argininosuccinate lyase|nr:argininosuccinate lyase [Pyrinomonadaceae bacterium]
MSESKKLWGGRFRGETDSAFARYNRSFGFDRRLFEADARASLAHCESLRAAGVLSEEEASRIAGGLRELLSRAAERGAEFFDDEAAEDVHSFIEARLIELVGDAGRRLHTGRSRNDQVATALRLWLRDELDGIADAARGTQVALLDLAESHADTVLPGYTHLQRAQPVLFAHWCLAYFEMLARDRERLAEVRRRVNVLPLGAAALAGTSYKVNREEVARALGFESVARNSLDAVSDRDFCVEFAAAASLVMAHLSRLAEDLIIYATTEFGFVELSDSISTGSSLMPQKKNPDALELVRGKSARIFGHTLALLTLIKGLPLTYNKDMQEDKEAVFDVADTVRDSLEVTATVLRNVRVREARARDAASVGYMNATEMADYLVRRGLPFREAHETVGRMVLHGLEKGLELHELELEELRGFSPLVSEDVYEALSLERTLASKSQTGGTSPARVAEALAAARASLACG